MVKLKIVLYVVFTCVLGKSSVCLGQSFNLLLPPKKSAEFFISKRLWGTDCDGVGFNSRKGRDMFYGICYDGWSDWNRAMIQLGTQKILFQNVGAEAQTWTSLKFSRLGWPSVHEQKYSPAMSLGLEFECSSLGAIDSLCFVSACKVATTPWQWMTQVSLWDGPFTVIVSVGELGEMSGWRFECTYTYGQLSIMGSVEGPRSSYSFGLRYEIKGVAYLLRHRSREFGGSSDLLLAW